MPSRSPYGAGSFTSTVEVRSSAAILPQQLRIGAPDVVGIDFVGISYSSREQSVECDPAYGSGQRVWRLHHWRGDPAEWKSLRDNFDLSLRQRRQPHRKTGDYFFLH